MANLTDADGNLIEQVLLSLDSATIGQKTVTMGFSGKRINQLLKNQGKLKLMDLMLMYNTGTFYDLIDKRDEAYETQSYDPDTFQQQLVTLGDSTDQGNDSDSDNLFNTLTVDLGVKIAKPGSYNISARLTTADNKESEWVNQSVTLNKGDNTVNLSFDGKKIRQLQQDGPYVIRDLVIEGMGSAKPALLFDMQAYTTKAYQYTQFQAIDTDLAIDSAGISFSNETPSFGETVTITAQLSNKGIATTDNITVEFFEGDPTAGGVLIGTAQTLNGLAANKTATFTQPWSPVASSTTNTSEERNIYVVLNRSRSLSEFDYANNIAMRTITVGGTSATSTPFTGINGEGKLSIAGGGNTCKLTSVDFYQKPEELTGQPQAPNGWQFDQGLVGFKAENCDVGATLTVTVDYPQAIATGSVLKKWGKTAAQPFNHWYDVSATTQGKTLSYTVTDGGLGDDDLTADGTIVDPAGIANRSVVNPPVQPAQPVQPVPLDNIFWLLVLALGGSAWHYRRKLMI